MTIFDSIILGVIEGFTEFLPISSTGHLIVASEFLGINQTDVTKAYEVIIQFAAILAVVLNYRDKFTIKKIDLWTKVFLAFVLTSRFHGRATRRQIMMQTVLMAKWVHRQENRCVLDNAFASRWLCSRCKLVTRRNYFGRR